MCWYTCFAHVSAKIIVYFMRVYGFFIRLGLCLWLSYEKYVAHVPMFYKILVDAMVTEGTTLVYWYLESCTQVRILKLISKCYAVIKICSLKKSIQNFIRLIIYKCNCYVYFKDLRIRIPKKDRAILRAYEYNLNFMLRLNETSPEGILLCYT